MTGPEKQAENEAGIKCPSNSRSPVETDLEAEEAGALVSKRLGEMMHNQPGMGMYVMAVAVHYERGLWAQAPIRLSRRLVDATDAKTIGRIIGDLVADSMSMAMSPEK